MTEAVVKPEGDDGQAVPEKVARYRERIQNHPFDRTWLTNLVTLITFSWLNPTLRQGSKRQLAPEDMYQLPAFDTAEACVRRLERKWDATKPRSFLASCFLAEIGGLSFAGAIFVSEVAVQVGGAYLLGQITRALEQEEDGEKVSDQTIYLYAMGMSLCALMNGTFHHVCFFMGQRAGHCLRTASVALVYKKALRLSTKGANDVTVGHMTTLVSNDVERFFLGLPFIHFLWIGPLQTVIVAVLLWDLVGPFGLCGIGLTLGLIPLHSMTSKMYARYRQKTAKRTDLRVRIMSEILGGMRVIKMYVWEKPFGRLIASIRKKELEKVRKTQVLKGSNLGFFFFSSSVITFLTLVPFVAAGNKLTAYRVFTSIALFDTVRLTMTLFFPFAIQYLSEMSVSCARIERFLRLPEHESRTSGAAGDMSQGEVVLDHATYSWDSDNTLVAAAVDGMAKKEKNRKKQQQKQGERANGHRANGKAANGRTIENGNDPSPTGQARSRVSSPSSASQSSPAGSASSSSVTNTLTDLSVHIRPGQLVGVVGPVGSGKTTLIMGLLRELPPVSGSAAVCGRLSYASQEPWIVGTTLRENILFGAEEDRQRFEAVLRACALEPDLQQLPSGENALIGERGVTLSGGQKARVSLARAVYRQADIYLLDDPLSAVDAKVGRVLFDECICGLLAGKTRILATHQVHHLARADTIIVLDANGHVAAQGTYDQLLAQNCEALMSELQAEAAGEGNNSDAEETAARKADAVIAEAAAGSAANAAAAASSNEEEGGEEEGKREGDDAPLFKDEDRHAGQVTWSTYSTYFRNMGSALFVTLLLLSVPGVQALYIGVDIFLADWVQLDDDDRNSDKQIGIYAGLLAALAVGAMARAVMFQIGFINASRRLHDSMFAAVIASPIRFFDTNPVGRILNRFSKDTGYMDDVLPWTFLDFIQLIGIILGTIILASVINPWVLLAAGPILVVFVLIRSYFLRTAREVKRIEAICRSPIYSHFSTSLAGLATIRSQGGAPRAIDLLHSYQNMHARAVYMFLAVSRWLGFRLDFLSFTFITVVVFAAAALRDTLSPGFIGLSLAYALRLTGAFQWCVRQSAEVENHMTSVERAIEYSKLVPETQVLQDDSHDGSPSEEDRQATAATQSPLAAVRSGTSDATEERVPTHWPDAGGIVLSHMSMRYDKHLPPALKDITMVVPPGTKVGIVGRTGAGKSSILAALFRLSHVEGCVCIDGVDVTKLPLHRVREVISVIPQDPTLFSGSVRYNLDPFERYTDADIWAALETVQLKEKVSQLEGGLEGVVQEQGTNFSVGQKQLICLARALLRRNKILVIDEATAHVDDNTDRLIQQTLRHEFSRCTVLTIAHRLHTIMDSDMIAVMDAGCLVEYDQPYVLLQKADSHLSRLAANVEADSHTALISAARRHYTAMESVASGASQAANGKDPQPRATSGQGKQSDDRQQQSQQQLVFPAPSVSIV